MMEKKRRKRGENSYLNDFHPNLAGEYIYDGTLYACQADAAAIRTAQRRIWAAGALLALLAVAGGCIPAPGMQNHFYVILPYLGELIAALTVGWALVKLGRDWTAVREYVYERTVPALPRRRPPPYSPRSASLPRRCTSYCPPPADKRSSPRSISCSSCLPLSVRCLYGVKYCRQIGPKCQKTPIAKNFYCTIDRVLCYSDKKPVLPPHRRTGPSKKGVRPFLSARDRAVPIPCHTELAFR